MNFVYTLSLLQNKLIPHPENKKKEISINLSILKSKEKSNIEKYSKYQQLKRLDDFLAGKITHYVIEDWLNPRIVNIEV